MTYIEVDDDVRLHVQDLGSGPVVVLVSGFGLDHELWDRQVRVLTSLGRRVVCVSQRGHGLSDRPLHGYEVDRLATDLVTALGKLGVRDATVVGHSFGGQITFHAGATAPQIVSKLVLVGSNAVRASRSEQFPFGAPPEPMLHALVAGEREDRIAARHKTILSGFGSEPDPRVLEWLVGCSLRMPSWSAIECYRSMLTTDLLADIPRIHQPVLQIIGETDPVHSATGARWLQTQLHNATLIQIPDCGHYPMLEAPDAFDAELSKFLSGE